jgi:hypothetical protein
MDRAQIAAQLAKCQLRIEQTRQDIAALTAAARGDSQSYQSRLQLDQLEKALEMHVVIGDRLKADLEGPPF